MIRDQKPELTKAYEQWSKTVGQLAARSKIDQDSFEEAVRKAEADFADLSSPGVYFDNPDCLEPADGIAE